MWRIKSSLMSSKNNDPPASNRRDPDDDGLAVVVDRPLTYSNVTAVSAEEQEEPSSDNEGGITVVPAADDEDYENNDNKDMKADNLSELSISPNQFTDSLLDAMNKLEEKDGDEAKEDSVGNETVMSKSIVEEHEDDDEGILVDELTKEEEDFLAGLDIEPIVSAIDKTTETANAEEYSVIVDQVPEKETKLLPPLSEESLLEAYPKETDTKELPFTAEEETTKKEDEWVRPSTQNEEKLAMALFPVLRVFTVVLGVASFVALALSSTPKESLYWNEDLDATIANVHQEFAVTDENLPRPAATPPLMMMAPLARPSYTYTAAQNSTSLYNVTGSSETGNGMGYLDGAESDPADSTWEGTHEILLVGSTLVFYYIIFFWIRSGGPSATGGMLKFEGGLLHQSNESVSLNSFQGMLSFHKRFVKSGKGRRGTVGGKCDVSSAYDKLTRPELLKILDGFDRYTGRDAAKFTLIRDLCSTYEDTLYRFSSDQILQILQAKGYSVDTKMTKHDLVTLTVNVGF
mmetsp:Transcript_19635/g.37158  ORF Transcript_19635/g.37158 Transcript_19635/m.37158 type:complete len:518 (-) Transcript_19635:87-1640(-)